MKKRVSVFEPGVLVLGGGLSVLTAAVCMQIMGQLGMAPNTSLIGAILVMAAARVPLLVFGRFRDVQRQNYVLNIASAAGFAAANAGFMAIATIFVMGRAELFLPMAAAALVGGLVSVFVLGRLFDSRIFPARAAWPQGVAAAGLIEAGNEGGKKSRHLVQGLVVGGIAGFFGLPAASVGIAFIADMWAMGALAVGILLRGFSPRFGFDIGETNIAQGAMIGAGIIALIQIISTITKGNGGEQIHGVDDKTARGAFIRGAVLFAAGAALIGIITGILGDMPAGQMAAWVLFAGLGGIICMVLIGTAAMHSGWAPGFAVVAICLTIGMFLGFPPLALAVLVGYLGAVGLPMVDAGMGLKTGWLIRGKGADADFERYGRRQQIFAKYFGVLIGIGMAVVFGAALLRAGNIPPMSIFYGAIIDAGASRDLIGELAIWAVPGAILQAVFGSKSVGMMIATGLLINNPAFGIGILAALSARLLFGTKHMQIRGPGLIAGDGLFGFLSGALRIFF